MHLGNNIGRLLVVGLVVLVGVSGCVGIGGSETTVESEIWEDGELTGILEVAPPEGYDPEEFIFRLGVVFGFDDPSFLDGREIWENYMKLFNDNVDESDPLWDADIHLSLSGGGWELLLPEYYKWPRDEFCRDCLPASIGYEEALVRAKEVFAATGVDVDAVSWSVDTLDLDDLGLNYDSANMGWNYELVRVTGSWLFKGEPLQSEGGSFEMDFADGDVMIWVRGQAYSPVAFKDLSG